MQSIGITTAKKVPVLLCALSVGIIITNLFAPQTLVALVAAVFGLDRVQAGLMVMTSPIGYAAGLIFVVPLADILENRRLVVLMLAVAGLSAVGVTLAPTAPLLFVSLFTLGLGCAATQVLVPSAAALAEPSQRGRVIGDIMSGLMVGILLSRPIASLLSSLWGWRTFYIFSGIAILVLALVLFNTLESHQPSKKIRYRLLITSLTQLLKHEPVLRNRSISAAVVMAAFNLYWTSITYVLSNPPLGIGQQGIALFALVGAGGAVVTPVIGRLSDRGLGRQVSRISHAVLAFGFVIAGLSGWNSASNTMIMLLGLGAGAVLLDIGVLGNQTVGRHMINTLAPQARGRINALFVAIFFIGGAVGSAMSGILWNLGGWTWICAAGFMLSIIAALITK